MGLMFLYWLATERRYVHRQADVPKGVDAERVDVPTDIAGLMGYLNDLVAAQPRPQEIAPPESAEPEVVEPSFIEQAMRKCDVEEAIQNATAADLVSYAENVADRLRFLTRQLEKSDAVSC